MRLIDEYFCKSIEKTLYHYTGIGALLGIAEKKHIWASNVYFMNDSKEIIHACDVLKDLLLPRFVFGDQNSLENIFLKQFQDWLNKCRDTTYNIFIFSLSEKSSLLSQWRSYTPHGKGVSVGFSKDTLNRLIKNENFRLAKCLYDKTEQEDLMRSLVNNLLESFKRELPNIDISNAHPTQSYHNFLEGFRGEILQVLSIIKHKTFEEEQEWRLISPYYSKFDVPVIKFREGASMLTPYIEIPLGELKPYFAEVILGPSQHENLSMSALSMYLSNNRLCDLTTNCTIPYREW